MTVTVQSEFVEPIFAARRRQNILTLHQQLYRISEESVCRNIEWHINEKQLLKSIKSLKSWSSRYENVLENADKQQQR